LLESSDELDDTPGIEAPAEPDNWDILLGILAAVHPDYNGSNEYKTSAAPYFRIDWKERIILGGRDENDNSALADLGDDESVIELGGFAR
jgi:outer membrane scaffolding protein for murein synthesis (MipA/OmpV family)